MVKGFGRECAVQLGLVGRSVDVGHEGPDLLAVLRDQTDDLILFFDKTVAPAPQ